MLGVLRGGALLPCGSVADRRSGISSHPEDGSWLDRMCAFAC
jgi:hypothetical protein